MEENVGSLSVPVTKVFVILPRANRKASWLKNVLQEKFGKVLQVHILRDINYTEETIAFVTFEKPEHAELAIQAKVIRGFRRFPVYIYPANDQHQPHSKTNNPMLCDSGHVHRKIFPPLATTQPNREDTDTSPLPEIENHSDENNPMPNSNENVESDDECKIFTLPDECLRHIFSFLDKKELIKVERVCKWWQTVSLSCWPSFKGITIRDIIPDHGIATMEMLRCVLKRCGKYVEKLDIVTEVEQYDHTAVDCVAEYCSSLRELYIGDLELCSANSIALSNSVKQLEVLGMPGSHGLRDNALGKLFFKCQKLRRLDVSNVDFTGKCLKSLNPNTMEKLTMYDSESVKISHLIPALKRLKNLKCLKIDASLQIHSCDTFYDLIQSVPNLEHFIYKHVNSNCPFHLNSGVITFGNLVNLTYLNVDGNKLITDQVLLEIINNCVNIKKLVLSGCGARVATEQETVTDFGVKKLVNLRQLRELSLSYLEYVTDHSLEALALAGRLIKLEIHGNPNITDDGCGKIVSLCENLEHFDISGCDNITEVTVMAAEAAVKSRTCAKTLVLVVGGTLVQNREKWKNVSPMLIVSHSNLCVRHRRPDMEVFDMFADDDFFDDVDDDDDDDDVDYNDDYDTYDDQDSWCSDIYYEGWSDGDYDIYIN